MNLKLLAVFILSSLLLISCGSDDDDGDTTVINTPPQTEEEADTNPIIRYNAIELFSDNQMDNSNTVRMDLNRRPVILTGSHTGERNCSYTINLNEAQADKLEARANRLRVCNRDVQGPTEDIALEVVDTAVLTLRDGSVVNASKFNDAADFDIDWTWICASGRSSFYSYLNSLIKSSMPAECPASAARF